MAGTRTRSSSQICLLRSRARSRGPISTRLTTSRPVSTRRCVDDAVPVQDAATFFSLTFSFLLFSLHTVTRCCSFLTPSTCAPQSSADKLSTEETRFCGGQWAIPEVSDDHRVWTPVRQALSRPCGTPESPMCACPSSWTSTLTLYIICTCIEISQPAFVLEFTHVLPAHAG